MREAKRFQMRDVGVILLAAGLGKRMKSSLPKVLHPLAGKPLLYYSLRAVASLKPVTIAVVVGHGADQVRQAFAHKEIAWVTQERQLGTGHAVQCARQVFDGFTGDLLIVSGDVPLISQETLLEILQRHRDQRATLTLLTAELEQPYGYGRIVRDRQQEIMAVVEERDAGEVEKKITEVNAGLYAVSARFLFFALEQLTDSNQQGEYYLPDIVGVARKRGEKLTAVRIADAREVMGVNTREELAIMEKSLQEQINRKWMEAGVTLKDPSTTYIEEEVVIGKDTVIGPNTHLKGKTVIGERCAIDGSAYLTNARLADGVHLRFSVVLSDCELRAGVELGPFAHIRPGTVLDREVHIGNFVEVKNSHVGEKTKANHLSYIGDATVGKETNIGAGTITCNYDGFRKYRTTIGDRVQVGSDSTLVAPIQLGDDVYVATASTVRHDIPAGALVYNERVERVKEGWTEQKRKKMENSKL